MGCNCNEKQKNMEKPKDKTLLAPKVIAESRLTICKLNRCGKYRKSLAMCKECGCFLKLKTYITSQKCPLGHW